MDLVRRCLRIDPEERPSIKEVLKDAKRLKKTHVDELREKYDKPLKRKRRKAVFTTRKRTRRTAPSAEPAVTNKRVVSRRRREYHDHLDDLDDVVGRQWDPEWQRPKDPATLDEATRLYFVKHEINNMRRGRAAFPRTKYLAEVYSVILEHGQDPDWPAFRGPVFAWGDLWTDRPEANTQDNTTKAGAQKTHPMRRPAPQPPSPHRPPAQRTDYEALFMKELTDLYAERLGLWILAS